MELHYGQVSGNSARAAFGLYEAAVAFTPRLVDIRAGENRAPAHLAVNPMGKVPALTDGDIRLWESNAINWYAAEKNPAARLIPATTGNRASMQRWLLFQAAHVSPACSAVFKYTNDRCKAFWGWPTTAEAADAGRAELARFLPVLDQALGDRQWLEGEFSLADIAYAPHFWLLADGQGGFDFSSTPALAAWLQRLWARPAWKKARLLVFGES